VCGCLAWGHDIYVDGLLTRCVPLMGARHVGHEEPYVCRSHFSMHE